MALPLTIPEHFQDLDPTRTFVVGAQAFERILGIFTVDLKGRPSFVDIAIVNDFGNIEFFDDKRCACKRALCEPGRSRCGNCRVRGNAKMKRYLDRERGNVYARHNKRRREKRQCTTESSSTPS